MVTKKLILLSIGLISINTMANQYYVAPPTSSTKGHVPVISDEQMEKCVEIYNQSKWLGDSLQNMLINIRVHQ